MKKRTLILIAAIILISTAAFGTSWDAFKEASWTGIHLDKQIQSGITEYTITLDPGATLTYNGATHNVEWIQAFYVLTQETTDTLTAAPGVPASDWKWKDSSTAAGWNGGGQERIMPSSSKTFKFSTLTSDSENLQLGLHLGYVVDTGFFKEPPSVPEPTTVASLCSMMVALPVFAKRRRK